jgi:adenylosuccinate lyase
MPEAALKEIRLNAKFEESRIKEIEKKLQN